MSTGGTPGQVAAPKPPAVKVAKTKVPGRRPGRRQRCRRAAAQDRDVEVPHDRRDLVAGRARVRDQGRGPHPHQRHLVAMDPDGLRRRHRRGRQSRHGPPVGRQRRRRRRAGQQRGRCPAGRTHLDDRPRQGRRAGHGVHRLRHIVRRLSRGRRRPPTCGDGNPTYTPKPTIITRSQWGARRAPRATRRWPATARAASSCTTPRAPTRTPAADSKAIVRATQAYHVKSRGWCDIGYNFLVDKYGQIFEGRRGGVDRAVRAAHSATRRSTRTPWASR